MITTRLLLAAVLVTAACASTPRAATLPATGHTRKSVSTPSVSTPPPSSVVTPLGALPLTGEPCPHGSPLPDGRAVMIDYVDLLVFQGRTYLGTALSELRPRVRPAGADLGQIRCSLVHRPSDEAGPPLVEGTATRLPVETRLATAVGVPSSCEVLARSGTELLPYLVQVTAGGRASASSCWRRYPGPANRSSLPVVRREMRSSWARAASPNG